MLKPGLGMVICKNADQHSYLFGKSLRVSVFLEVLHAQVKLTEIIDSQINRIETLSR